LQEKEIEEEDNDDIIVVFSTTRKKKKKFKRRGEGRNFPSATTLKLLSSSCNGEKSTHGRWK
jgi:hypothetical protein